MNIRKRVLTQDELGEKGESRFKELCADAKLICNKSDRDRAGWDFIVDFQFGDQGKLSLDKRLSPTSCHIQVKTIYSSTQRVRLKLNMAERLAKELKPSFIFVIKVSDDLSVSEVYLIHLLGDRLGSVLKRLRKESASGTNPEALNKKYITFKPRPAEQIRPSGEALSQALYAHCSDDLYEYSRNKNHELQSLGFEGFKYECRMSIPAGDKDELASIFLGQKTNVEVKDFESFERRFGILIQDVPQQAARLTIDPHPTDHCKVMVRCDDGLPPAIFDADIFVLPPFLDGAEKRIHIKSLLFEIDLYANDIGVRPQFKFDISNKSSTPDIWWGYWRALRAIAENKGEVEIDPERLPGSTSFKIMRSDDVPLDDFTDKLLLCDALLRSFAYLGINKDHKAEWLSLEPQLQSVLLLDQSINNSVEPVSLPFEINPELHRVDGMQVVVTGRILLDDGMVAYYSLARATVKDDSNHTWITLSDFIFRRGKLLDLNESAFAEFLGCAKTRENIEVVVNYNLSD